jgi:hemoglobin/transferrin/lactoferrin receptor protein
MRTFPGAAWAAIVGLAAATLSVSSPAQPPVRPPADPSGAEAQADPAAPQDGAESPPQRPRTQTVVVTPTRREADAFELPQSTIRLDADDIRLRRQARSTPEMLKEVAGVSVQKTSHGQGSPKIRGRTGFQTLLLVDGIRMNDSTWRVGNVEYWNHLDPYSFERFEVVRGPGSVLWGSDAVSGLGHALAKERTTFDPGFHADAGALFRYASAEDSYVTHGEVDGNLDDFGWHVGATYKDFGDLEAGRHVGLLPDTGYAAADVDAKLTWRTRPGDTLTFATQHANLRNVPRTHSTTANVPWRGITRGTDLRREHDHRRWHAYARWETENTRAVDRLELTALYKYRYERQDRVTSQNRRSFDVATVDTLGFTLQANEEVGEGDLVFGADWYRDFVDSSFREFNADGSVRTLRNRGPVAGDATYDIAGLFAEYDVPLARLLRLVAGLRYSYVNLSADDIAVTGITTIDHVSDHWHAITGSVRLLHETAENARTFVGVSQGFRAPNLSDTTRFDLARTNELEIPADDLDPETTWTFEVGGRYDDGELAASVTGWYALIEDQIGRVPTGAVGGNGERIVSKANLDEGWLAGVELEGSVGLRFLSRELIDWSLFGNFDYVEGRTDQFNSAGVQIRDRFDALPPATGMIGLRWQDPEGRARFEAFTLMAYHDDPSRYTEAEAANTSRIPPGGLPGYAVVGVRGSYAVTEDTTVSLAVENLNDVDYRIMDSGLQEPGTNAILTVASRF